jgi:hypothetical protein
MKGGSYRWNEDGLYERQDKEGNWYPAKLNDAELANLEKLRQVPSEQAAIRERVGASADGAPVEPDADSAGGEVDEPHDGSVDAQGSV